MQFSQRTPRSEIHFYLQKLYRKGYTKIDSKHHLGGYKVVMERIIGDCKDVLTVKFSNNGWCSILSGNHIT